MNPSLKASLQISGLIALLFIVSASGATGSVAPAPTTGPAAPADFPAAYYDQLAAQGKIILRVDSPHSLVTVEVHRAGLLSGLGHDHVVASRDVAGYVSVGTGVADLYVPLDTLVVDDPVLRTAAGMNTQPSQQDVAGTRRNMLTRTLDAAHFPFALIHITRKDGSLLMVSITLHRTTRNYSVAAQFEPVPGGISVAGSMTLRQSDFGITPLALLGGALKVRDRLDLRFRILAQRN
jgi:hypothetical protein